MTKRHLTRLLLAGTASLSLVLGAVVSVGPAVAAPETTGTELTNTAHLDFLLDEVSPGRSAATPRTG